MDRNDGSTGSDRPGEDTSRAESAVQNAAENRDALEAQNRRVESTTPDAADRPIQGTGSGNASEDTSQAREALRRMEEDTEAMRAQNARVEASTPPDVNPRGPQTREQ